MVLEGQLQEGIRELDLVQTYSEVQLGSLLALIWAHKRLATLDREAVTAYDVKLKEERKRADDQALYYAGTFLLHIDRADKAKEYVDRSDNWLLSSSVTFSVLMQAAKNKPSVQGRFDTEGLDGGCHAEGESE